MSHYQTKSRQGLLAMNTDFIIAGITHSPPPLQFSSFPIFFFLDKRGIFVAFVLGRFSPRKSRKGVFCVKPIIKHSRDFKSRGYFQFLLVLPEIPLSRAKLTEIENNPYF